MHKPQPTLRNTWTPVGAEDHGVMLRVDRLTGRVDSVEPLFTTTDQEGHEIVVAGHYRSQVSSQMTIILPGLCGHYECGGQLLISLN